MVPIRSLGFTLRSFVRTKSAGLKRRTGGAMSLDPMAAAVDWLDAYRDGDIETILTLYAHNAVLHCGCGGMKTVSGKDGLRTYWQQRLLDYPASDLDDLRPSEGGAAISYVTSDNVVGASLTFDASGKIASQTCGPPLGAANEPDKRKAFVA